MREMGCALLVSYESLLSLAKGVWGGEGVPCHSTAGEQLENDKSQKAVAELSHFRNPGRQAQNCIHFCSRFQIL